MTIRAASATYSQVGAQFGYGLAWTLVLSYPLMAAIQEISARIGRVTGIGIAGNLRRHYSGWLSGIIVLLLLVANQNRPPIPPMPAAPTRTKATWDIQLVSAAPMRACMNAHLEPRGRMICCLTCPTTRRNARRSPRW
jgi:hypothetical protein